MVERNDLTPYLVKVARPVFEVTVVEVRAGSHEEAVALAREAAAEIPDEAWSGAFDPDSYGFDIQDVIDVEQMQAMISDGIASPDAFAMPEGPSDGIRYAVLRADTEGGEGSIEPQPWMQDVVELMLADLASDWAAELQELAEDGFDIFLERRRSNSGREPSNDP